MIKELEKIPFLTEETVGELENLSTPVEDYFKLREDIISGRLAKVEALWVFTNLTFEGNPQVLLKTPVERGGLERLYLNSDICKAINGDVVYDYETSVISPCGINPEEKEMLLTEINEGRILTIYDKERL